MRIIIQRVNHASVKVEGQPIGQIAKGLLLFVGIGRTDSEAAFSGIIEKILNLRIFPSDTLHSSFDSSLREVEGEILIISQFTLYADCSKGRRPSFFDAMPPQGAEQLYKIFCEKVLTAYSADKVAFGKFGADMQISLENDGPVTLILE